MEKSGCQIREEDEKFSSLIGVSDDVVRRLSGEEEEASESHSGMWEGGGELDAVYLKGLDEFWVKRLACMETTHTSRNRFTEDEFYKVLSSVEKQFDRLPERQLHCTSEIGETIKCYKSYKKNTLKCKEPVKKLVNCMDDTRDELLKKSAAVKKSVLSKDIDEVLPQ